MDATKFKDVRAPRNQHGRTTRKGAPGLGEFKEISPPPSRSAAKQGRPIVQMHIDRMVDKRGPRNRIRIQTQAQRRQAIRE
jgi:hypothetical protein